MPCSSCQDELASLEPVVSAVGTLGEPKVSILLCASQSDPPNDLASTTRELNTVARSMEFSQQAVCRVILEESPFLETLGGTAKHDLVVMSLGDKGAKSGSQCDAWADDVAKCPECSLLLVRGDLRAKM